MSFSYIFLRDHVDRKKCRVREAAKKVLLLMARPLRPNPQPPLELYGRWNVGTLEKNWFKESYFFLNGPALYPPPPLLMVRPLREGLFFATSLS